MGENNVLKLIEYYMLLFMYVLKSTVLQPFVEWIDSRIRNEPNPSAFAGTGECRDGARECE